MELNERDYPELRDAVSRVCDRFGGPYWQDLDAREAYPTEFVKALTKDGYLAVLIPEEYGGAGLPLRAAAVILEEIHASGGNAGACHAQMYTMGALLRHGSLAQRAEYLPLIASGELRLQAFGVTEPTSGSDTTMLRTTAVRDGADFVVNGQKVWTSRALHSDLMLLLARTTPVDQVKRRTDGLVPAANLIGEVDEGFKYILDGMNAERILIASESFGDGRWFIDKASRYATERQVFGRPIGQNQGVQFPIARAYVQLRGAELMLRRACALFDEGKQCGPEANMAKLLNSEAAWVAGEACLQTHGGFGYAVEYDVERKWRETRLYQIAPISTNLILAYVGEHVLGMPRSY